MSEQMWLVVSDFESHAVTSNFDKGEEYLREEFCNDHALDLEKEGDTLGIDLKLGDWCITRNRVRQRGYHLRKIDTL